MLHEGHHIDVGGSAPVQAATVYRGRELYLRARWSAWTFELGNARGDLPSDGAAGGFWREGRCEGASYMPLDAAERRIARSLDDYADALRWVDPSLLDEGPTAAWTAAHDLSERLLQLLAVRAPLPVLDARRWLGANAPAIEAALAALEAAGSVCRGHLDGAPAWVLPTTWRWIGCGRTKRR